MTERVLGSTGGRRRKWSLLLAPLAALSVMLVLALGASANVLPGSSFEIDDVGGSTGANLILDSGPGDIDWATVGQVQAADFPTGQTDDSYKGGMKEDTACPETETGSIPNNKSDLLNFGSYFEPEAGGPGYLHVYWRRVQEPNGTTNMDFEFNKSSTDCDGAGSSKNVTRTVGDVLLQYDIDQGGAQATLTKREWLGSAWSDADVLSANEAIGSINQVAITNANSDGLGAMSARTFGEASFDLAQVFDPNVCESFGSAMLKSRSSDAFTSQLKDFIAPIPVNITNCAKVIIRKVTQPAGDSQSFGYHETFNTDPAQAAPGNVFSLTGEAANDDMTFNNVIFGTGLMVTEDPLPTNWEFFSLDCSASTGIPAAERVVDPATRKVTFTLNAASDILDCTYTNRALGNIKLVKNTVGGDDTFGFTHTISGLLGPLTTSGGTANDTSDAIAAGTSYAISEDAPPTGWDFTSAACKLAGGTTSTGTVSGRSITNITVEAGKTTVCTFTNTKRGAITLVKNTVGGNAIFGFTHTISGLLGTLTTSGGTASDTSDAIAPGTSYAISEDAPPTGWAFTSAACKLADGTTSTGTVSGRSITNITVEAGKTTVCTFTNTRLHKVIVIVCHEDTNTLIQSSVELVGGATKNSLSSSTTPSESQLCNLGGATFGGLGHGNQDLKVNVGSGSH